MRARVWVPLGFALLNAVVWAIWYYVRWCPLSNFVFPYYVTLITLYFTAVAAVVAVQQFEERGLKKDFQVFSLSSPDEIFEHMSSALRTTPYKRLVDRDIREVLLPNSKTILIYGPHGSGKTHTLIQFIKKLVEREKPKGFRARLAYHFRELVGRGPKVLLPKGVKQEYLVPENIKHDVILVWDNIHLYRTSTFLDVTRRFQETLSKNERDFAVLGSSRSEEKKKTRDILTSSGLQFQVCPLTPWEHDKLRDLINYCSDSFLQLDKRLRDALLLKSVKTERTPGYVVSAFWMLRDLSKEKVIKVGDIVALPSASIDIWCGYVEKLIERDRRFECLFKTLRDFYWFMPSVRRSFVRLVFCKRHGGDEASFESLWNDLAGRHLIWVVEEDAMIWETVINGIEKCIGSGFDRDELLELVRIVSRPPIKGKEDEVWVSYTLNNVGHHFSTEWKDFDTALELFKKALELNRFSAMIENNFAQTLTDLSPLQDDDAKRRHLLVQAEPHFKRALELKEDFYGYHYNYGNLLRDLGRHEEAEEHFKRALELKEDFPEAVANLGFHYMRLGKIFDGLEWLFKALWLRESLSDKGQMILEEISFLILEITQSKMLLKEKQNLINTIKQSLQNILGKESYKAFINQTVQQLKKQKIKAKTLNKITQLLQNNHSKSKHQNT